MEKNYYKVMAKTQTNNTYKAPWRESVRTEDRYNDAYTCNGGFAAGLGLDELLLAPEIKN